MKRRSFCCWQKVFSSKQIAERLGIAKITVDTRRRNLLRKTGAKNTLELAIRLMREYWDYL